MGRFFAGTSTRRARVSARKGLRLADLGVSKKTQQRYYVAVQKLLPFILQAATMERMDELICDWIEDLFATGEPLNTVADALSGLHYFLPVTRRKLLSSWKLFGVWRKYEVPSRAPPLTADLVLAMASWAIQQDDFAFGALLLIGFHCFLRTGELLQLRTCDILVNAQTGIVCLQASKGGLRFNTKESVTIEDPVVLAVAAELVLLQRQQNKQPIWFGTGSQFRSKFAHVCKVFQVEHLNFRPYSLRRGGATAFFLRTGLMERTLVRGRWASSSVARLYICDGLSQLPNLRGSPFTKKLIRQYLPLLSR